MMINQIKQSWLTLGCLQLSGALSLPVILIGYYLGQHGGTQAALLQLGLGNAILFCLSAFYLAIIHPKKWVTIEFAQHLFGSAGTYICAVGMVLSLIGWSAIQINLIGLAIGHSTIFVNMLMVLLIYAFTCRDLTYLATVNKLLLPIICLCFCYMLVSVPSNSFPHAPIALDSFKIGLMMVITAGSGLVFDLPTFYRHAATPKDGLLGLIFIFGFALPLVECAGIYLAKQSFLPVDYSDWMTNFINHFDLFSLFFLMLSGLLGTCLNLYSAGIIVSRTIKLSYQQSLLLCSVLAAMLSLINLEKQFGFFLEIINLNAEIMTALLFMYVMVRGRQLPMPDTRQKRLHQSIFYLVIFYAITSKFFQCNVLHDVFLETALLTCGLMMAGYGYFYFLSLKDTATYQGENT
ncbi:MAG: hypothetical protein P4M14_07745 [Gammaproteobacteria bacterium]|nr:hypothetical protein [Gammaproteobacteria bacterium]